MAELHPQIVHVTIVLALVGVAFRVLSLATRVSFAGPAAAILIIAAAVSSIPSVQSGVDAHGPVERVPGARPAVVEHEEWGERARNVLLVLGAIELLGLALRKSPKVKVVHAASAVVGPGGGLRRVRGRQARRRTGLQLRRRRRHPLGRSRKTSSGCSWRPPITRPRSTGRPDAATTLRA